MKEVEFCFNAVLSEYKIKIFLGNHFYNELRNPKTAQCMLTKLEKMSCIKIINILLRMMKK